MNDIAYWTGLVSIFTVAFIVGKLIPTKSAGESEASAPLTAQLDRHGHSEDFPYR